MQDDVLSPHTISPDSDGEVRVGTLRNPIAPTADKTVTFDWVSDEGSETDGVLARKGMWRFPAPSKGGDTCTAEQVGAIVARKISGVATGDGLWLYLNDITLELFLPAAVESSPVFTLGFGSD